MTSSPAASPAPPRHRSNSLPGLVGWLMVPTLVLMEFVNLERGLSGRPAVVPAFLYGFVILTALTCWAWVARLRDITRPGRASAASWVLLVLWALAGAATGSLPVLQRHSQVSRMMMVAPVLTALLTFTAAWGLVLASPRGTRRERLWITSLVVLVCSYIAWPREMVVHRSWRLATGMGGSAIYHVVLLLCLGINASMLVSSTGRRRLVAAVATALSALGVLLTGSRAGLLSLLLYGVLVLLWVVRRGIGRRGLAVVGAIAAVFAAVVLLVPGARRLFLFSDPSRMTNLHTAMHVFNMSWRNRLIGVGSGHLWPWDAYDSAFVPRPGSNMGWTRYGLTLTSPHSLALNVLVELGIGGTLVLLVLVAALVRATVRAWTQGRTDVLFVRLALLASLLAFVFDTYLFKNFAISFWWWVVLAGFVGVRDDRPDEHAASDRSGVHHSGDHHDVGTLRTAGESTARG